MAEATSRTGPSSGCDGEEARQPSAGNRVVSPRTPASLFLPFLPFFFSFFFGFDVCLVCPNVFFGTLQIGDANRPDGAVLWSRRGGMQNSPKPRLTPPPIPSWPTRPAGSGLSGRDGTPKRGNPFRRAADATGRTGLYSLVATGEPQGRLTPWPTRPAGSGLFWSRRERETAAQRADRAVPVCDGKGA